MATLTYWYCECIGDSDVYSIITKTKREALAKLTECPSGRYEQPVKKTLAYADAFDLFDWVTSEGGGRGCGSAK